MSHASSQNHLTIAMLVPKSRLVIHARPRTRNRFLCGLAHPGSPCAARCHTPCVYRALHGATQPVSSIWLAYYVSLSRPRSFGQLLSHGLPDRSIIESGPPAQIAKAFAELFTEKIAATKIACAKARQELGWPA